MLDFSRDTIALVLAAGKGTRMRSSVPKVLHPLLGRPLLGHVLGLLRASGIDRIVVVVGHGADRVMETFRGAGLDFVIQEQQLGTGHAVACAEKEVGPGDSDILIICGDTPLIREETLKEFIRRHQESGNRLSILSSNFPNPTGYGRIVRDHNGVFKRIVEEKDALETEKRITEINTGTYLVDRKVLFTLVKELSSDNAQGEYYLTDIVELAVNEGLKVDAFCLASEEEALGVNSRYQLAVAEKVLLNRKRKALMDSGVTISMPDTVYVEPEVRVEPDSFIGPGTILKGKSTVGAGAFIAGHCYIEDAQIPAGKTLEPFTILRGKNSIS